MKKTKTSRAARVRRHARVRRTVSGSPQRPRLAVYRSLNHISAQIIDDAIGHTLVQASDASKELKPLRSGKKKSEVAGLVGEAIARKAKEKGISTVVLDRGGFRYHGRVKALAEAARKGGLSF
ncbi:MAG: 50S ribosomal protein L18 [Dehalococcoidia bacterium]|nr:50S ribosomal protein L18 [Dehalococcoidia bacterium]